MVRLNKRNRGGGAGGRAFQYVRGNYKPLMGTNLAVAARDIYDEARNRIHARNGETEESTEVVNSPLLVYINLLALLYVVPA